MGFWSGLGKVLGVAGLGLAAIPTGGATLPAIGGILGAGGAALAAGSQASADNRGASIAALLDADKMKLLAAQDQRASESDIMKKLAITSYLKSGGASQGPRNIMLGGANRQLPTFGFGPKPASAGQMQGASELEQLLLQRIMNPQFKPTDVSKLTKAGTGEKLAGILGAGLTAYDTIRQPKGSK